MVLHHLYDHSGGGHDWALAEARREMRIFSGFAALRRRLGHWGWRQANRDQAREALGYWRRRWARPAGRATAAAYRAYRLSTTKALRTEAERSLPPALLAALDQCHAARRAGGEISRKRGSPWLKKASASPLRRSIGMRWTPPGRPSSGQACAGRRGGCSATGLWPAPPSATSGAGGADRAAVARRSRAARHVPRQSGAAFLRAPAYVAGTAAAAVARGLRPGAGRVRTGLAASAEGEGVGFDAGIDEFDGEQPFAARILLPDQLIEALRGDLPAARVVNVHAMIGTGRAPSSVTRNRTGLPDVLPNTRWRSRARKRKAILPPGWTSTARCGSTVQRPARPQSLSR